MNFIKGFRYRVVILMVLITCFAVTIAQAESNKLDANEVPDHITLTWTDDPMTTQTITWRTDTSTERGFVQFVESSKEISILPDGKELRAKTERFSSDLGEMNIHTVTLNNLKPNKKYAYRVGDGTHWSAIHHFVTEAPQNQSFKFLIFGDSQSGDRLKPEYGPWQETIQSAFKANPDARFVINMGDLVETGQSYAHWQQWFKAAAGVIDEISEMPVQGNHETYNPSNRNTTQPIYYTTQFKLSQNGPDPMKGQVYSFDYGDVHFAILDSQEEEEGHLINNFLEIQKAWLDSDLKQTSKKWKLVFFHRTPYYNKATRTNENVRMAFQPIIDKYHADVVFNGHDHGLSRTYPIYGDSFVNSPDKGTIYYVTGRSGAKYYSDLSQKIWDAFFFDPQDQPNYVTVEAKGDQLTINGFKQDGTLLDTYTIDKANHKTLPVTIPPGKYHQTMLVVYGNLLQQPFIPINPSQINGKWYVPVRAFMEFVGAGVEWKDSGSIMLSYAKSNTEVYLESKEVVLNGKKTELTDPVLLNKGVAMISADDLNLLFGFTYQYNADTNVLMITK